jgi:hypothetical protein
METKYWSESGTPSAALLVYAQKKKKQDPFMENYLNNQTGVFCTNNYIHNHSSTSTVPPHYMSNYLKIIR